MWSFILNRIPETGNESALQPRRGKTLSANHGVIGRAMLVAWRAAVIVLAAATARAQVSDVPVDETAVTNGAVFAIARSAYRVYIAGDFTYVGGYTGCGVPLSAASGQAGASLAKVNDTVNACTSDGAGGWYIGGDFTQVGGMVRNHIAHLLADCSLDPAWNPGADGPVHALALSGSTLYVGGDFAAIAGLPRVRAAALSTSSGQPTAWDPEANDRVDCLAVADSVVYAGGIFTNIGGTTRTCIAALDPLSGAATAWNPHAMSSAIPMMDWPYYPCEVYALATSGTTVYAGGTFDGIGAAQRTYVAALDVATGLATAWNAHSDGFVRALALSGGTLYAAGSFSTIGGLARPGLAALDVTAGAAGVWNPTVQVVGYSLAVSGSTVYAGVVFPSSGGAYRYGVAAFTGATGQVTAWDPMANAPATCLAVSGASVYAGGSFSSVGGLKRVFVASLDAATGLPTPWDAAAAESGNVQALAVSGSTVYVGGYFNSMGGQPRSCIAALDGETGQATTWAPAGILYVASLAVSGSTVYVGTTTNGSSLLALDAATGAPQPLWQANPDGSVYGLAVSGSTVYAGGGFRNIGGKARSGIAALDAVTGLATPWHPDAFYQGTSLENGMAISLAVAPSTVYAAGFFDVIGGKPRVNVAALDRTAGLASAWDAQEVSGGENDGIALAGPTVYVAGDFSAIGGQPRRNLAAVDTTTGLATAWNPGTDAWGRAVLVAGSTVYAGGDFLHVGGQRRHYFAQFHDAACRVVEFRTDGTAGAALTGAAWQAVVPGSDCAPVTAVAPAGYRFQKWRKNGADYSTANPLAVTNVTEDAVLVAVFIPHPVPPVGPAWMMIQ